MMMDTNLFQLAYQCIMTADPATKSDLSEQTARAWFNQEIAASSTGEVLSIAQPGQPAGLQLVAPNAVPRRKIHTIQGLAALLHALAHIEFNAINLAWDAVYRFQEMPTTFYDDWIGVAAEETYHFQLLQRQLQRLGYEYGDLPAHNGLWEMAVKTEDALLKRMALVPRVLEARGLDATPLIMEKLQRKGETHLIEILTIILHDEIDHVAVGNHWFHYCCQQAAINPITTFQALLQQHYQGKLKLPFNISARLAAGFSQQELDILSQLAQS